MKNIFGTGLALLLAVSMAWAGVTEKQSSSAEALAMLKEGNSRFVAGKAVHPRSGPSRLAATASGQYPFATVLTCSDSRTPPEILFDQGVGDLFVIRVAGNVIGQDVLASIEYGVEHLHTPLLLVLGHTHCGAVTAALQATDTEGAIPALLWKIQPAVRWAKAHGKGDVLERAIERNVELSLQGIQFASPVTRNLVEQGKLQAAGAIYDLASGKVRWLNF